MFHSDAQRRNNWSARPRESTSPPHKAFNPGLPSQPAPSNIFQEVGVACSTVGLVCVTTSRKRCASITSSRATITILAPTVRGSISSSTEGSKVMVVIASTTSSADSPGRFCIAYKKFTTLRCSICTPLGRPVDPEVCMM